LEKVFTSTAIDAVLHFAARLLVQESVEKPLEYYRTNVGGSVEVLRAMQRHGVTRIVYSSSAAVYGIPEVVPITEDAPTHPVNPYGQTKLMVEHILHDASKNTNLRYVALRYFNVTDTNTSHLLPNIVLTAQGKRSEMRIFGTDYPTPDGTAIRDYIHIDDLVDAHLRAVQYVRDGKESVVVNVGTASGCSVLQMVQTAKQVFGKEFPVILSPRRAGDPPQLVASYERIRELMGWQPRHTIEECIHAVWEEMGGLE
jgi:UDP-glucose 4-epimerase